MQYKKNYT